MQAGQTLGGNRIVGWDKGRYYTRSRKVNGRVVREYVGSGKVAEAAAQQDAIKRQQREAERDAFREKRAEQTAFDAQMKQLDEVTDLLAGAALMAAGYRRHNRGEWRKRRGTTDRPD
jgi:hypothetical protein